MTLGLLLVLLVERIKMSGRYVEGATRLIHAKAAQICPAPRPVVTRGLSLLQVPPAAVLTLGSFIVER